MQSGTHSNETFPVAMCAGDRVRVFVTTGEEKPWTYFKGGTCMKMKKSGFLTFCCSMIPGAGEMYMGFYKQGLSLMLLFFVIAGLSGWSGLEILFALLPVVWFYSFFHTHNLRSMTEEQFAAEKDRYFLFRDEDFSELRNGVQSNRRTIAIILIILGGCMLLQIAMNALSPFFGDFFWQYTWIINRSLTSGIVALVIIWMGIRMLTHKKELKELNEQ